MPTIFSAVVHRQMYGQMDRQTETDTNRNIDTYGQMDRETNTKYKLIVPPVKPAGD
jgi:hypothetical protein